MDFNHRPELRRHLGHLMIVLATFGAAYDSACDGIRHAPAVDGTA
ncbi:MULTISPECIES: hypothetical protein [unclassified Streptomyces]